MQARIFFSLADGDSGHIPLPLSVSGQLGARLQTCHNQTVLEPLLYKYILPFGQICFTIYTNTLSKRNKKILRAGLQTCHNQTVLDPLMHKYILPFGQICFTILKRFFWLQTCHNQTTAALLDPLFSISQCIFFLPLLRIKAISFCGSLLLFC